MHLHQFLIDMKEQLFEIAQKVRNSSPLVHNITNYVVMNSTANALLAIGASPVMAHAVEEVEDMVKIAHALVINIGTLSPAWVNAMHLAVRQANLLNKPVVLDPVGAGATPYRNKMLSELLETGRFTIIRGNASEILAMASGSGKTKGVDSTNTVFEAIDSAKFLNDKFNCTVCISGQTDIVISGKKMAKIHNGHEMMSRVTGLGCTATAIIGAFAGTIPDPFLATLGATAFMGVAGELAAKYSAGPGTLQLNLLDKLYNMKKSEFMETVNIEYNV
jgi:hydroxyethylthiazole kinase